MVGGIRLRKHRWKVFGRRDGCITIFGGRHESNVINAGLTKRHRNARRRYTIPCDAMSCDAIDSYSIYAALLVKRHMGHDAWLIMHTA